MQDNKMADIIKASVEGIKSFTEMQTTIGTPIYTESGVTVIPVYKVIVGFASGGVDYAAKRMPNMQNFGGGGGTGISITPTAFLTVNTSGDIKMLSLNGSEDTIDKIIDVIERAPEISERIKGIFS